LTGGRAGIELRGRNIFVRNHWQADLGRIREELNRDGHHCRPSNETPSGVSFSTTPGCSKWGDRSEIGRYAPNNGGSGALDWFVTRGFDRTASIKRPAKRINDAVLQRVVAQIQNMRQLEAVVSAMHGIAASRAQCGRSLLPGIDAYSDVISRAIGQALLLLPADTRPTSTSRAVRLGPRLGLVLFCAEQGFAGGFSERILDAAANDDLTHAVVFLI
jgi:hypothetical protein